MITAIKTINKVFMIPCYEDTKKKHKLYLFTGKVGTVPAPRIWFVDNLPEAGQLCMYINEDDGHSPEDKNFNMCCGTVNFHYAMCTEIRGDGEDCYILVDA